MKLTKCLDSSRGLRTHAVFIDEARDQDGQMIQEVVIPQMNVSRRMVNGNVNPREIINTQIIYGTSAGTKSSYSYGALIDILESSIIDPKRNAIVGFDYRVPMQHGLIDPNFVRSLKMSPSYSEQTFAAEYCSVWLGGSEESWFDFGKLSNYRKLKNPEWRARYDSGRDLYYYISVDIGRKHDQTVVTVFRVNIRDGRHYASVVYIEVLGRTAQSRTFSVQARDIKKIIANFNPREVLIDVNGIGAGIADEMYREQYDEIGNVYPPYGFMNDEEYKKVQPKTAPQILWAMRANGKLKSDINSTVYSRLTSGMVRFLITEQDARTALLATKQGQRMSFEQRTRRLLPHEMTTKLFEEAANLRLRRAGNATDIVLEPINTRFPDDKYYSFAYGLWRIKELEEKETKKRARNPSGQKRKLFFFTGGR